MEEYITKNQAIHAMEQVTQPECFIEDTRKDFAKIIEELPPADAAPVVHARWETPMALIQCSHCGFGMFPDGYYFDHGVCVHANESWFRPDYCPQCGARMGGEEE